MKLSSQVKSWSSAVASACILALGAGCGVQDEQQEAATPESLANHGTDGSTAVSSSSLVAISSGYRICRYLRPGDFWYPSWIYCCDNADRSQSYWIASGQTTGSWFSGSCYDFSLR